MYLTRFNSWDANVILCLSTILPEALVITMMKIIKSVHEMYCLTQAKNFYWDRGAPSAVAPRIHINVNYLNNQLLYRWYLSEPDERPEFYGRAYENGEHCMWTEYTLRWIKGFHCGRFLLMDMRRRSTIDDIIDYPNEERDFIVIKNHIDDLFS